MVFESRSRTDTKFVTLVLIISYLNCRYWFYFSFNQHCLQLVNVWFLNIRLLISRIRMSSHSPSPYLIFFSTTFASLPKWQLTTFWWFTGETACLVSCRDQGLIDSQGESALESFFLQCFKDTNSAGLLNPRSWIIFNIYYVTSMDISCSETMIYEDW